MLKLGARQKFKTETALEYYRVHKTFVATAKALSEDLGISITPVAIADRFKKEGIEVKIHNGRPIEPGSMTAGERTRKWRERQAQKVETEQQ